MHKRKKLVGIAIRYGLDCPGTACRLGRDFPHLSRPALEPSQSPVNGVPGPFLGVNRPGRSVNHPPASSAEVKEIVELCL